MRTTSLTLPVAMLALWAAPATAQHTTSPATPESRTVYLGSWLDDASLLPRGTMWAAFSTAWTEGGVLDFPVVDLAFGTTARTHAGFSVPVARLNSAPGTASIRTAFAYVKFQFRDPALADDRLGVAITPVMEISGASVNEPRGFSVGVPVNLEIRHGPLRVYGSTGFFSRGAIFGGGALEVTASPRIILTGTVGHTFSTSTDMEPGLHRTDLGLGASAILTPTFAIFGALGRSAIADAAGLWLAAGVSVVAR